MIHSNRPFIYLRQQLYYYHVREGSLSKEQTSILNCTQRVLQKHHKAIADAGDARAAEIYAGNMLDLARRYYYSAGNIERTASCVRETLAYDPNLGQVLQSKVLRSIRHSFVETPTYADRIRLLCCEFEIRTNSQDVINRLCYITQRAEQDVPVAHQCTVIITRSITWTGDEFRISGDGIEDEFEFTATSAVETLYKRLNGCAIAALPDYIRINAASGMHAGGSFLILGPERAGTTTLALSLMLERVLTSPGTGWFYCAIATRLLSRESFTFARTASTTCRGSESSTGLRPASAIPKRAASLRSIRWSSGSLGGSRPLQCRRSSTSSPITAPKPRCGAAARSI